MRRYGLYAPIRNAIGVGPNTPKSEIPLYKKFIAGVRGREVRCDLCDERPLEQGAAGALASFLANPTDLMKVCGGGSAF